MGPKKKVIMMEEYEISHWKLSVTLQVLKLTLGTFQKWQRGLPLRPGPDQAEDHGSRLWSSLWYSFWRWWAYHDFRVLSRYHATEGYCKITGHRHPAAWEQQNDEWMWLSSSYSEFKTARVGGFVLKPSEREKKTSLNKYLTLFLWLPGPTTKSEVKRFGEWWRGLLRNVMPIRLDLWKGLEGEIPRGIPWDQNKNVRFPRTKTKM